MLRVTVIDPNREGVHKAQQQGFHGEVGDATPIDVLEHARLYECKAIVITPGDTARLTACQRWPIG